MPDLEGKRILITGASGGIGQAIARRLSGLGASLALVGRRSDVMQDLVRTLPGGPHLVVSLDVVDSTAWSQWHDRVAPDGLLHGLVTAAAVLTPIGPIGSWDVTEFRSTLEVNVIGTLLPITTFLAALKAARGSIVTLSGGGATGSFPFFDAYASSKAAVVRLTENLAIALRDEGVRCNSVAPGFIVTAMHESTLAAGPEAAGVDYYERTRQAIETEMGDSVDEAADLIAYLLSDSAEGVTGKLISAKWDPWREGEFRQRLQTDSELATLRRIDDEWFTASHRRLP